MHRHCQCVGATHIVLNTAFIWNPRFSAAIVPHARELDPTLRRRGAQQNSLGACRRNKSGKARHNEKKQAH